LIPHVQVTSNEPDLVSFLSKLDWGVKMLASLDACRRVAFENIEDAAVTACTTSNCASRRAIWR
jgi:adenosine deaminase